MKKMLLVFILVLAMAIPAFALGDQDLDRQAAGNQASPGAIANTGNNNTIYGAGGGPVTNQGGTGIGVGIGIGVSDVDVRNINLNKNINVFNPTNVNAQSQGQQQGQQQKQGQLQDQINVNDQVIAPKQIVLFKTPTQLPAIPSSSLPELNFGNGRIKDATGELPSFAIYGIKKLGAEMITEVISINANVKFKKLYKKILENAKEVANGGKKTLADVRYQIIRHEANSTRTLGFVVNGGGTGIASSGLGGGAGGGGIGPQWGQTFANDVFDIIFVRVVM